MLLVVPFPMELNLKMEVSGLISDHKIAWTGKKQDPFQFKYINREIWL